MSSINASNFPALGGPCTTHAQWPCSELSEPTASGNDFGLLNLLSVAISPVFNNAFDIC